MTYNTQLKGNWNAQKEKLKTKYPALTENDLSYQIGGKNEMLEKLQVKLGKTREELFAIIEAL